MLPKKKFQVVNEGFNCEHCRKEVSPTAAGTPRNHCPYCLWSKHVDINPGDRSNTCKGLLEPIGIYNDAKKTYVILHQCKKCGKKVKSKAIIKDDNVADNFEVILELSRKPIINGSPR